MKAMVIGIALGLALTGVTGCQREDTKEPLKVSGKVFIFNYRVAEATYVVTLARNGPLPDPSFVETTFENPAGGAPLVTHSKIFPFWEKVSLESPPVHCVAKGKTYAVDIRILDGEDKVIQTIKTSLTSTLDQSIMPGKPLVVGPVYTPNPEVYGADGKVDYAQEKTCPAA